MTQTFVEILLLVPTALCAGFVIGVITSIVSKTTALPIYARVEALESSDGTRLNEERRKLQIANIWRATLRYLVYAKY